MQSTIAESFFILNSMRGISAALHMHKSNRKLAQSTIDMILFFYDVDPLSNPTLGNFDNHSFL